MSNRPILLSTWSFGMKANAAGWPVLSGGGSALDAAEAACIAVESDPEVDSVGVGGLPDASGEVSLDGAVMLSPKQCGGVCYVRRFTHPVSMARRVMERTIHVLLAGAGAEAFAREEGFAEAELLTERARAAWERWRADPAAFAEGRYRGWVPPRNVEERQSAGFGDERHDDTVGVLAIDGAGTLAGACSTSGMAFKVPGRVGDSPTIGHALYVEPGVGGVVGTGTGELMMRTCAAFLGVERMRAGDDPEAAIRAVLRRIAESTEIVEHHQAAFIALRADGVWSAGSLFPGFRCAVRREGEDRLAEAWSVAGAKVDEGSRL